MERNSSRASEGSADLKKRNQRTCARRQAGALTGEKREGRRRRTAWSHRCLESGWRRYARRAGRGGGLNGSEVGGVG